MSGENPTVVINGKEYPKEDWMNGMNIDEINYMLKARYLTAFFRWYPDLFYDMIKPPK